MSLDEYCIGKESFCPTTVGFLRVETVDTALLAHCVDEESVDKQSCGKSVLSCDFYEPDDTAEFDNKYWAARSLTILTAVLGLVSATFISCAACVAYDPIGFIWFAVFFILFAIFSGLSLMVLSSNVCSNVVCLDANNIGEDAAYECVTCELSSGGILAIVAGILWALAAISIVFTPEAGRSKDLSAVRPADDDRGESKEEESA